MERLVLCIWCWKKRRQQHPESPRRARLARTRCAPWVLAGPCFVHPASPFQSTRRASSPEPCAHSVRARLRGPHPHALPFPRSRDETRSRPSGCGAVRTRDSRRPARIRGGVGSQTRAPPCASDGVLPGGLKGQGGLAWAETGPIRATKERGYPAQPARSAPRAFEVFASVSQRKARPHQSLSILPVLIGTEYITCRGFQKRRIAGSTWVSITRGRRARGRTGR